MRLEISDTLLRVIVGALQEMPYKTAAPALEELQRAINEVRPPQGLVDGAKEMEPPSAGTRASH
jgi:hypothetical protein